MDGKLRETVISFLDEIVALAKDEGYQAAKKEFDNKLAKLQFERDRLIVENRELYYNEGFSDGYKAHIEESERQT